jgi:hypothetical protein
MAVSCSSAYARRFSRLRHSSYSCQKTSVLSAGSVACAVGSFDTIKGRHLVRPWGKTIPYSCSRPRISWTQAVRGVPGAATDVSGIVL